MFRDQTAERGGDFVDNLHKVMLDYAQRFKLATEDLSKEAGEVFYVVDGQLCPEEVVVDEYRELVPAMREDINTTSGAPTADNHTDADVELDVTSLKEWLVTGGAGPVIDRCEPQEAGTSRLPVDEHRARAAAPLPAARPPADDPDLLAQGVEERLQRQALDVVLVAVAATATIV